MQTIDEHGFLRGKEGNLTLVLNVLSFEEAEAPVLLVSRDENIAYLRRSPGDIRQIRSINAGVIDDLREAESIMVLEVLKDRIQHTYVAASAPLEEDTASAL